MSVVDEFAALLRDGNFIAGLIFGAVLWFCLSQIMAYLIEKSCARPKNRG